jgi:site-specific recombinase XerD
VIEYFDYQEIEAVFAGVDRTTVDGRRDYAPLATMFNTGAPVQEIVALWVRDLQLEALPQVRLYGKGRKERLCPLWSQTTEILRALLAERGRDGPFDQPVFCNHRGGRLTRFGVRYPLGKYCAHAKVGTPTFATKRLHPHRMRHYVAFLTMSRTSVPA